MPSVLAKSGLHAALIEMAESVNASGTIAVGLSYEVSGRMLPVAESNLFRIIQEATNNIIKHAGATKEEIYVGVRNDDLVLHIKDNGRGFDKTILSKISGNGLNNIYSRVNALRGNIDIVTSSGNGTQINIAVPLKNVNNG
jgi:signal transduction histidine kinase